MEFKGTKGEWSLIKNSSFYEVANHCDYKDGDRKFYVSCHINIIGEKCVSDSLCLENEANAKLIAAAPELLEALQWLLLADPNDETWDYPAASEKARQIIKKALT